MIDMKSAAWIENKSEEVFWALDKCLNFGCDEAGCYYNLESVKEGEPYPIGFVEHISNLAVEICAAN